MDFIAETQRLSEYYCELDRLVHQGVPQPLANEIEADLSDPLTDHEYLRTMSLWLHVYVPFYQVFSFIANNRILHEDLPLYLEEVPSYGIAYSADTIARHLKTLIPSAANELIHTISGTDSLHTQLYQALLSGQDSTFCQLVHNNSCDLHVISYLCQQLMDDITSVLNLSEDQIELVMDVSLKSTIAVLDHEFDELSMSACEFDKAAQQLRENDSDQNFRHYMESLHNYLCMHLRYLIQNYCLHSNRYLAKEKSILDAILNRKEAQPIVHEAETALQQYLNDSQHEESPAPSPTARSRMGGSIGFKSPNIHFQLADNYFSRAMDSSHSNEFFYCHEEVLKGGPDKLTTLINFLSDHDYISKDILVKSTLAYRLTGKGSASHPSAIFWNGRNCNPYELIYLVKHLTCRGDYKKMRRFFVGPRWVKGCDSSYAKSANYDFKKFLHELYPTICPL